MKTTPLAILLVLAGAIATAPAAAAAGPSATPAAEDFLEPDRAFAFALEALDGNTLRARWAIADGYYLYRDKLKFRIADAQQIALGPVTLPPGEVKNDEFFGRVEVYHRQAEARIALARTRAEAQPVTVVATYQGCAEAGLCYPPVTKTVTLALPAALASPPPAPAAPLAAAADGADTALSEQDRIAQSLASGKTWLTVSTFFGFGLLLAFTPCVFPMIPILSGIIVGQGDRLTTRRAFVMSAVYVLAMAATYTGAGVVAGLVGENLQAAFQNPWIVSGFAAVFVLLALSMFGFYDLQLPSRLQTTLTEVSNRQRGGNLVGVGIMGVLSALIVGPCVAAPLAGALIYIGQTGDPWLGGTALFTLSLGMGAPLLAIGTSAGKLLPRAGAWMEAIKAVFGVLLLAVAIWMLERVLPAAATMGLWAVLLLVSAAFLGVLDRSPEGSSGWARLRKGVGLVFAIYGALLLVGVAAGGRDALQPLHGLGSLAGGAAAPQHLAFKRVKTVSDLEREVASAAAQGKPVMLDFYADWCIACKEYEKYTFSDPGVQQVLAGAVLLQADVTANDAQDKTLLATLKLLGPPSILFYGPDGRERRQHRLVGFLSAGEFRAHAATALR